MTHQEQWNQKLLENSTKKRDRETKLSLSEMATIIILFAGDIAISRRFMELCLCFNLDILLNWFLRFIELMPRKIIVLCSYLENKKGQLLTAFYSSVQSKAHEHKVFQGFAKKGKLTIGWFFRIQTSFSPEPSRRTPKHKTNRC